MGIMAIITTKANDNIGDNGNNDNDDRNYNNNKKQ